MQVSAVNHIRFNTVSTVLRRHVLECQQWLHAVICCSWVSGPATGFIVVGRGCLQSECCVIHNYKSIVVSQTQHSKFYLQLKKESQAMNARIQFCCAEKLKNKQKIVGSLG